MQCSIIKKNRQRTHQRRQRCILLHGLKDVFQLGTEGRGVWHTLRLSGGAGGSQTLSGSVCLGNHLCHRLPQDLQRNLSI